MARSKSAGAATMGMGVMLGLLALALLLASFPFDVAADGPVHTLKPDTLQSTLHDGNNWMVKYYAPWCGHCKRLAPTWKELAEKVKKEKRNMRVAKFDCTLDRDACSREGVRGYPTVRMYRSDGRNYTYSGPRTVDAFLAYSDAMTREVVTHLKTSKDVKQTLALPAIFFVRILPRSTNKAADEAFISAAGTMLAQVMCYDMDPALREGTALEGVRPGTIARVDSNRTLAYTGDATNTEQLLKWMQDNEWETCFELTRETGNRYAMLPSPKPLVVLVVEGAGDHAALVSQFTEVAEAEVAKTKRPVFQFAWAVYQKVPALTADVWGLERNDLPAVIVHNVSASAFYRMSARPLAASAAPDAPPAIDPRAVTSFLQDILDGKVESTDPHSLFSAIAKFFSGSLLQLPSRLLTSFAALQEEAPMVFYITIIAVLGATSVLVFAARDVEEDDEHQGQQQQQEERQRRTAAKKGQKGANKEGERAVAREGNDKNRN